MDKFPDWAESWLSIDKTQVSHGLNLALKLEDPNKLPLLLWDIVVAKPKIYMAMQELSFIHFARFVPSWDGTALMVTTEFDGPLKPYVMDFVIALGDVFDTLLSYVDKSARPKLPVRDHPNEFWDFVEKWNRVPFARRYGSAEDALFPPGFDYPVYSAYPEKTVTDIAGKRTQTLPPAIDQPAAYVDLDDVQGNILSGYRAKSALHLFFSVVDRNKARRWLAEVFPEKSIDGSRPWGGVMSAARWKVKDGGTIDKPSLMANVGFTYEGLEELLPDRKDEGLQRFPRAFREGAEVRSTINGDVGPSDPNNWLFGRHEQRIHVVLSLYVLEDQKSENVHAIAHKPTMTRASDGLIKGATENGMNVVCWQGAGALPDGKTHFGYRDGISKPRISGQCKPDDLDFQPAASPGEFLLGRSYKSIFGGNSLGDLPEDLATNGTFCALRLLEQHVDVFEKTIKSEASRLKLDEELLKAKLLGRWADGQPLALDPGNPSKTDPRNDFDYAPSWEHPDVANDHEGQRCPVGAHIRRTNPRTARVAGQRHSHRLIRRGMPTTWKDDGADKVGLLGLFIGASLEHQFEFVQQQWIQGDLAASGIRGTQDPIAGLRSKPTELDVGGSEPMEVPPLVTTRGSLYLFFPSISMLRGLTQAATPSALRVLNQEVAPSERSANALGLLDGVNRVELSDLSGLPPWIREFLDDLLFKKLDSKLVKTFIGELASPPRGDCESDSLCQASDIRPLDPRFIADPFPAYAKLRQAGTNVVWVPEHQAYWVLTREIAERLFNEPMNFLQQPSNKALRGIITMDGERHTVVRKVVEVALEKSTKTQASYITESIDAALSRLENLEQFDFITAYGAAVPRAVFWRIFGLRDKNDMDACDALAHTMMRHFSQPERPGMLDRVVFADASVRLAGRLGLLLTNAWLQSLRPGKSPFDETLLGEIARQTAPTLNPPPKWSPFRLSFLESLMTLVQLVLASTSTQFLLGTAMRNLLMPDPRADRGGKTPWSELGTIFTSRPGDFDRAVRRALEEARRVDPPVTIVERYAADDLSIGGVTVRKDCPIFAVVASSNRDSKSASSLEEFQWDRNPSTSHLSIGHGIHKCVGEALQAEVVPMALRRLIDQMPDLRLCDSEAVPAWLDNLYFRVLQSLPVSRCIDSRQRKYTQSAQK